MAALPRRTEDFEARVVVPPSDYGERRAGAHFRTLLPPAEGGGASAVRCGRLNPSPADKAELRAAGRREGAGGPTLLRKRELPIRGRRGGPPEPGEYLTNLKQREPGPRPDSRGGDDKASSVPHFDR